MIHFRIPVLAALLVYGLGVSAAEPLAPREPALAVSPDALAIAKTSRDFSLELYRQLATTHSGKGNLFCSPHSALGVLLMAAEGARGETAEQMGTVLHFPDDWRTATSRSWDTKRTLRGMGELQSILLPRENDAVRAQRQKLQELEALLKKLKPKAEDRFSREENDKLLRQQSPVVDDINRLRQELDQYELKIANAIWCDGRFPLRADYRQTTQGAYGASVNSVDFLKNPEPARLRINVWAADQTKGLIKDILKPGAVDSMTKLVLTNAVYFKGNWQTPFDKTKTQDEPFWVSTEDTVTVPLMTNSKLEARYVELRPDGKANVPVKIAAPPKSFYPFRWELPENPDGWKLIELPYRGGSLSMLIILPNRRTGLAKLEQRFNGDQLADWTKRMSPQKVDTSLPRFKLRTSFEMGKALQLLGMTAAFSPGGFTGLSDSRQARDISIGAVFQEAYVEVNEEGTEAAAVSAAIMTATGMSDPRPPTPRFRADHPFVCLIRDSRTGAVLFVGRFAGKD